MTQGINTQNFENLQIHASFTSGMDDDAAYHALVDQIMESMPEGVTRDDVMDAINKAIADEPDTPMEEILERVVKEINEAHGIKADNTTIKDLHNAWDAFQKDTGLADDKIASILVDPANLENFGELSETSIKEMLAWLYLVMIEIAGEESANQLYAGCRKRDEIMALARDKADKIRDKATIQFATQMVSAGLQVAGGAAGMRSGMRGIKNPDMAMAYGAVGSGQSAIAQGFGQMGTAGGNLAAGKLDADIAIIEGESQVASAEQEMANKLRQKASELIQSLFNILQGMSQVDYQTMTAIGRV